MQDSTLQAEVNCDVLLNLVERLACPTETPALGYFDGSVSLLAVHQVRKTSLDNYFTLFTRDLGGWEKKEYICSYSSNRNHKKQLQRERELEVGRRSSPPIAAFDLQHHPSQSFHSVR